MLAECSMLSRTYYAHFNAGIIRAPLMIGAICEVVRGGPVVCEGVMSAL